MFRAIKRFFKSIGYLLTGRLDELRKEIDKDPNVIKAKYDEIIRKQKHSVQQYMSAIASIISLQEQKKEQLQKLLKDQAKHENLKNGAVAMMNQKLKALKASGKNPEEIKQNPDYLKCSGAFGDFSTTLKRVEEDIVVTEEDINRYQEQIETQKLGLAKLHREIEETKKEAAGTIAEVISATEEKKMMDIINGISVGGTAELREEMQEMRRQIRGEARISRELAGVDAERQAAEFEKYATESAAQSEFDKLLNLEELEPAKEEKVSEADKTSELTE